MTWILWEAEVRLMHLCLVKFESKIYNAPTTNCLEIMPFSRTQRKNHSPGWLLYWQNMIYLVLLDPALAKRSFVCVDNPEDIV